VIMAKKRISLYLSDRDLEELNQFSKMYDVSMQTILLTAYRLSDKKRVVQLFSLKEKGCLNQNNCL